MLRFLRILFYLAVLIAVGLLAYSYLADLTPDPQEITIEVDPDAALGRTAQES